MNDRFEHQLVAYQSAPLVAGAQPTATLHLLPLPLDTFPYQACVRVRIEPVYTVEILLSAVPDNAADVASASYPPAWSRRDDHPHSALFPASSLPVPRVVVPGQQRDITLVTHSLLIHLQMASWSRFQDRHGGWCSLIWFSSLSECASAPTFLRERLRDCATLSPRVIWPLACMREVRSIDSTGSSRESDVKCRAQDLPCSHSYSLTHSRLYP